MPLGGERLRTEDGRSNRSGTRVRERRQAMQLKQEMLSARIADVTDGAWSPDRLEVLRIEQGTRTVTDVELIALAEALECDPCFLLLGKNPVSRED